MKKFIEYNQGLIGVFDKVLLSGSTSHIENALCSSTVDEQLRSSAPVEALREAGSFFTGDALANELCTYFNKKITLSSKVLDPTCGAGNLLLACTKRLPVFKTLSETLKAWCNVLYGFDLVESFIDATKKRIVLECIRRDVIVDIESLDQAKEILKNIQVMDAMRYDYESVSFTHLIMNPPFTLTKIKEYIFWKSGKVNVSAVIFHKLITSVDSNCQIVAILPEVLRSGSRYDKWRDFISRNFSGNILIKGKFDSKTNVDIFILSGGLKGNEKIKWKSDSLIEENKTIDDLFHVSIGPVVPHRDPFIGDLHPFIYPKMLPVWGVIEDFDEDKFVRFSGRSIKPPFVVIRRTSSPKDTFRAAGTLILGNKNVAVENHLIVIKPKNDEIDLCKKLMKVLKSNRTIDFLNQRIRCRHLTVSSIKEIPFNEGTNHE
ncbi:SAM-dependent DNA methyltransferase [Pantoea dispersa]|uniref:SAM-dependent DNA methyltransferase n=1 Tax=Pantoea dispersa TaxID=59814 RepID=UPI00123B37F8|nr:SAM-dependent DNA methyltransferase [Pantoea dispersa]KAA8673437.1 SAM-dependent DNA methyltransferase [Pantoea dispersa]